MPKSPCRKPNYYLLCECLRGDKNLPWRSPSLPLWWAGGGGRCWGGPSGPSSLAAPPEMPTMGPVQRQGRPGRVGKGQLWTLQGTDSADISYCLGLGGGVPTLLASDLPFHSL